MFQIKPFLALLGLAVFLVACTGGNSSSDHSTLSQDDSSLTNKVWMLSAYKRTGDEESRSLSSQYPRVYSVEFGENGRLRAQMNCWGEVGSWSSPSSDGTLEIASFQQQAYCEYGEEDIDVPSQLNMANEYVVGDRELRITTSDGVTLIFRLYDENSPFGDMPDERLFDTTWLWIAYKRPGEEKQAVQGVEAPRAKTFRFGQDYRVGVVIQCNLGSGWWRYSAVDDKFYVLPFTTDAAYCGEDEDDRRFPLYQITNSPENPVSWHISFEGDQLILDNNGVMVFFKANN